MWNGHCKSLQCYDSDEKPSSLKVTIQYLQNVWIRWKHSRIDSVYDMYNYIINLINVYNIHIVKHYWFGTVQMIISWWISTPFKGRSGVSLDANGKSSSSQKVGPAHLHCKPHIEQIPWLLRSEYKSIRLGRMARKKPWIHLLKAYSIYFRKNHKQNWWNESCQCGKLKEITQKRRKKSSNFVPLSHCAHWVNWNGRKYQHLEGIKSCQSCLEQLGIFHSHIFIHISRTRIIRGTEIPKHFQALCWGWIRWILPIKLPEG